MSWLDWMSKFRCDSTLPVVMDDDGTRDGFWHNRLRACAISMCLQNARPSRSWTTNEDMSGIASMPHKHLIVLF